MFPINNKDLVIVYYFYIWICLEKNFHEVSPLLFSHLTMIPMISRKLPMFHCREYGTLLSNDSQRCSTDPRVPEALLDSQKNQNYFHTSTKMLPEFVTMLYLHWRYKNNGGQSAGALVSIKAVAPN